MHDQPIVFNHQGGGTQTTLGADGSGTCGALVKNQTKAAITGMAVRRLTPMECERLQGFPDDYTRIPWREGKAVAKFPRGPMRKETPDGPRYKALGNSMAVPVMSWIGKRIAFVDSLS